MTVASRITVAGDQPYDVVVGTGLLGELGGLLAGTQRVLVVHPHALATTGDAVREDLVSQGFEAYVAEVPDAEDAKRAEVAAFCWGVLGQAGFTRTDAVVAVGGGAVTDLAGFVAATWLRGREGRPRPDDPAGDGRRGRGRQDGHQHAEGKNLVGAFHPPGGVLCDLDTLATLPRHDLLAGMAEVVKCGFIADPVILDRIEADPEAVSDPTSGVVRELVERAVQVKADVVGKDLRESGLREVLNYGHTLGHAIELVERYQWRHGAAVSVGMVFAAELARLAGRLGDDVVERHRSVLGSLGLPLTYRGDRWAQLLEGMQRDKKTRGSLLRFVVLDGLARPSRLEGPDPGLLAAAYAEIARD